MTITSLDSLINAVANASQKSSFLKLSISNTVAGQYHSLWRATGLPLAPAIPTSGIVCDSSFPGALRLSNPTGGDTLYGVRLSAIPTVVATDLQIHDRLLHCGGYLANTTAQQNVTGMDANHASLVGRIGASDYSDLMWWLEWYADTGVSVGAIDVRVTYDNGTTQDISVATQATTRASRMLPILPATAGRFIRAVTILDWTTPTGTAGNFGVTCTRNRCGISLGIANTGGIADWQQLGMPEIAEDSCLMLIVCAGGTTTGNIFGSLQMSEG